MESVKRNVAKFWPYFVAFLLFAQFWVPRIIGYLGDIDTACVVAGKKSTECGSGPLTDFLLSPPAWFLSLSFALALLFFAWGETKRQRAKIEKITGPLEGQTEALKHLIEREAQQAREINEARGAKDIELVDAYRQTQTAHRFLAETVRDEEITRALAEIEQGSNQYAIALLKALGADLERGATPEVLKGELEKRRADKQRQRLEFLEEFYVSDKPKQI